MTRDDCLLQLGQVLGQYIGVPVAGSPLDLDEETLESLSVDLAAAFEIDVEYEEAETWATISDVVSFVERNIEIED